MAAPGSRLDLQWPDGRRFIQQPYSNHNGGHLAFGPDGYLYIGLGDGGSATTRRIARRRRDAARQDAPHRRQRAADDDPRGYVVPPDNPFVGREPARSPEIWALGYRNPWRYTFDDVGAEATRALIVGDVGQGAREEIDYEPRGAGGRNYGWRQREGTIATPGVAPEPVEFGPLIEPVFDYGRGRGLAVTGGYVYRGTALPAAHRGRYFFADYGSGRVWSLGLAVDSETREAVLVDEIEHTDELGGTKPGLSSFARDLAGELYIVTLGGEIYRLASDEPPASAPDLTGERRRPRP